MNGIPLTNATRRMGAPSNWDHEKNGLCHTLEIHDSVDNNGTQWMTSAWMPTKSELKALNDGKPLFLSIEGTTHPVVSLTVGV